MRVRVRETAPVVFEKSGVTTGAAPRLFGLDAGGWSMILVGLALTAFLLALA